MSKSLGDRMKEYENINRNFLMKKTPVIIRLDGKAFHTFTKSFNKPFDQKLMDIMDAAAIKTAEEIQGFKIGYVQSDEVTFVLSDFDDIKTDAWFGYNVNKLCSISAATMTYWFNYYLADSSKKAIFDARVFNVPSLSEVSNNLLWRAQDWKRNSLQMYCQDNFSQKELEGKNSEMQHNMLHEIGKNWSTDLSGREKNGLFFYLDPNDGKIVKDYERWPSYIEIKDLVFYTMASDNEWEKNN